MKVVGGFNKVSPELMKQIPKLQPGQVVTFQMLNGVPNPDPDANEKFKNPMLFGKTQLRTNFRIFDKNLNSGEGGYADIAAIETAVGDVVERMRTFVAGFGDFQFQGKFSLIGGKIADEELYEVLWLSPDREGSPFASASSPAVFKIINVEQDSKAKINSVDRLRKALTLVANMDIADATQLWASLNKKKITEPSALMGALSEYAKDNYDNFLTAYEDPNKDLKSVIGMAQDDGIINYDYASGKMMMGKEQLCPIDQSDDVMTQMVGWLKNSENGANVLSLIKKRLEGKPTGKKNKEQEPA